MTTAYVNIEDQEYEIVDFEVSGKYEDDIMVDDVTIMFEGEMLKQDHPLTDKIIEEFERHYADEIYMAFVDKSIGAAEEYEDMER